MKVIETALNGLQLIETLTFKDDRGYFKETYRDSKYEGIGISSLFRQDNISNSCKGTLRGLHYQNPQAQGKLVSVLKGSVFDVAVDIRKASPTFGQWSGTVLSEVNNRQLWIPPGFAHGFLTLEDDTYFIYKCTETYAPSCEGSILWNDPALGIAWPNINMQPLLSPKDAVAPLLQNISSVLLFP